MLLLCCPSPPRHPSPWFANAAPTASPRLQTSTGAEAISRHRSIRVPSFVTIRTRGAWAPALRIRRDARKVRRWGSGGGGRAARNIRITERRTRLPQRWGIMGRLGELRRVRALLDSYKERGEPTAFLSSPPSSPPPLLLLSSSPLLPSPPPPLYPTLTRTIPPLLPSLHLPTIRFF